MADETSKKKLDINGEAFKDVSAEASEDVKGGLSVRGINSSFLNPLPPAPSIGGIQPLVSPKTLGSFTKGGGLVSRTTTNPTSSDGCCGGD